jgi:hypothetical protein
VPSHPQPFGQKPFGQKPFGQKPFGLSLSKAFSSLSKKGKRFDKLTANGVLLRSRRLLASEVGGGCR